MKRFATTLAVAALFAEPAAMAQDGVYDGQYGWTLSASNADPFANFGQMPTVTPPFDELYLWLACTGSSDGATAAEMSISFPAGAFLFGFVANAPAQNLGATSDLLLALNDCQQGPIWVGTFQFLGPAPAGDYCLVPNASTGDQVTVDCGTASFGKHAFDTIGFSQGGAAPPTACTDAALCVIEHCPVKTCYEGICTFVDCCVPPCPEYVDCGDEGDFCVIAVDGATWGIVKSRYR